MAAPDLFSAYRTLERLPLGLGRRAFSGVYRLAAPYFLTIPAQLQAVEPGLATARMSHTPWVRNHLGGVHAIALCNLAEFTMGAVAESTVPRSHRWVPKSMSVRYEARASGPMRAEATLVLPEPLEARQELPVPIVVRDRAGAIVFTAEIVIWVTARPA